MKFCKSPKIMRQKLPPSKYELALRISRNIICNTIQKTSDNAETELREDIWECLYAGEYYQPPSGRTCLDLTKRSKRFTLFKLQVLRMSCSSSQMSIYLLTSLGINCTFVLSAWPAPSFPTIQFV